MTTAADPGRARSPVDAARDDLGDQLRRLNDAVARRAADPDELADVTAALAVLNERLDGVPLRPGMHDSPFHPFSLVGGTAHPVAPQLRLTATATGVVGTVALGKAFEGGPNLAHGGVLALLFDHALGTAVYLAGHAAMTRTLEVEYRAPTPLDAELTVTAGVDRVDGRRVFASGEIRVGTTVTSRAEAVFVQLTEDNVAQIFGRGGPGSGAVRP